MTRSRVDDTRWQQVEARDRAADGRFVYAVTSTGIFCRPSCPSRRPRRDRVRFFDAPDAAALAGFRPCLRCRPLDPQGDTWLPRVEQACRTIAAAEAPVPLATLAREARTSPHHFLRQFTRVVGVSPREFADATRFAAVRRHLRSGADVTTALFEAGYGSGSRFYEQAAPRLAMPPSTYRTGGAGQHIRYTTARSPLGRLLVASTDTGVCAVSLGESDTALVAALRAEYPKATVARASAPLRAHLQQVLAYLGGRTPQLELPLNIRATAFQWQVWSALRAIPAGTTKTYGEVAAAIGRPTAARAVARACATNPVALAIPCHRVVPASGEAGGYRWGARRKTRLLQLEQRSAAR